MFVLITGSRTFSNAEFVWDVLDKAHSVSAIEHLVLGDCPTGADLFATSWAKTRGVPHTIHVADWSVGRKAGPLRNLEMCKQLADLPGDDKYVVAFIDKPLEESRGTNNTIKTARTRYQFRIKIARQPA